MNFLYSVLFIILMLSVSCSMPSPTEESVINHILENDPESVIEGFFEKEKLETESFAKVVQDYSSFINSHDLKMIEYDDRYSMKKRPREGYSFIDADSNIVCSITYKFVKIDDERKEVNFIDFRSSGNKLDCVKFPSKFPLKCIMVPFRPPASVEEINEYPKTISGYNIFHNLGLSISKEYTGRDTISRVITFNMGNQIINRNIERLLNELEGEFNLNEFTLAVKHYYGEPEINLLYTRDSFAKEEIEKIRQVIEKVLGLRVKVNSSRPLRGTTGYIEIGGIYTLQKGRRIK